MSDLYSNPSLARSALRRLTDTADGFGVILPAPLVETLTDEPVLPPGIDEQRAATALAIAESIALPAAKRAKATTDALDALARSEAARTVRARVSEALSLTRIEAVREHGAEVFDLFRDAIAEDLDDLNTHAKRVPLSLPDVSALALDVFESYTLTRTATARVEAVLAALRSFYPVPGDSGMIAPGDWAKLLVMDAAPADPVRLAYALRGMVRTPGGAAYAKASEAPWSVLAAHAGARFELADGATRSANAARLAAGRVTPPNADGEKGARHY